MASVKIDIVEFLEVYQQLPCLWDKDHPDYKNRDTRDLAEQFLLSKTKGIKSIKTLKAKIRTIRGTYNNEIRKMKSSMQSGFVYKPKLHWFPLADQFLSANGDREDCETRLTLDFSQLQPLDLPPPSPSPSPSDVKEEYYEEELSNSEEITTPPRRKIVKRPKDEMPQCSSDDTAEPVKLVGKKSIENEFTLFGKLIGMQLNKLSLKNALVAQRKIQEVITDARLNQLASEGRDVVE